jgi:hypothetical protein
MAIEQGRVNLRIFRLTRNLPKDAIERFKANALAPLEYIKDDPIYGWCTGKHLMDTAIDEDTARWGSILRLQLVKAEKKIPPSLLKSECRAQEMARMKESGQPFISRKERQEIRDATRMLLLPKMPPILKGIMIVQEAGSNYLFTDAVSEKAADALVIHFRHAQQITLEPLGPAELALGGRTQFDVTGLPPRSFSHLVEDKVVSGEIGHDFLTWLWFMAETAPEELEVEGHGPVGLLVEGPLTFAMEGSGAHQTTLRKGNPPVSTEARSALQGGKKLAKCRLSIAKGDEIWCGNFDGETMVMRGMSLPKCEEDLDPTSTFQMRVRKLDEYREIMTGLYRLFLQRRITPEWQTEVEHMRDWVAERNAVY